MTNQIADYNGIAMDIINQGNDFYLTTTQIGEALEYANPCQRFSFNRIYERQSRVARRLFNHRPQIDGSCTVR